MSDAIPGLRYWIKLPVVMRRWIQRGEGDECWLWTGAVDVGGYGRSNAGGRNRVVHRVLYEAARGPIPPGLVIDHLCRVKHCVNPAHLEPVTNEENLRRGLPNASDLNARKTHCVRGHPLDGPNAYIRERGGYTTRVCRKCQVIRTVENRRRRMAADPEYRERVRREARERWHRRQRPTA